MVCKPRWCKTKPIASVRRRIYDEVGGSIAPNVDLVVATIGVAEE